MRVRQKCPDTLTGLTKLKVFLDRAEAELVHDFGAQKKPLAKNMGKSVKWNRFSPLALATTPLTEGTANPSQVDMTTTVNKLITAVVKSLLNILEPYVYSR